MTAQLVRVFLSPGKVSQQAIILNRDMIIILVVMELRCIALMNDPIDVLLDTRLSQVNCRGSSRLLSLSWRVHVVTRMVQILLGVENQRALQYILFLERSQSNLFLPDILFGVALLGIRGKTHIETLRAKCWSTDAHRLLSTTGISAYLSILLDWSNWFRNRLVCFRAFLVLIIFYLSWWIKLLNDWISVLRFSHILLFSFSIWWLVLLVEYIRTCSYRWICCNWARASN